MLTYVNENEKLAVERLREFLADKTPWNRSLWGVGSILAIDEFYEACAVMGDGHLSSAAVNQMASSLQRRVGLHPAFTEAEKSFLRERLRGIPRVDGLKHVEIKEFADRVRTDYLNRWAGAVRKGTFTVEKFARGVAAYLLDEGFSGRFLDGIIRAMLESPQEITLPELCEELHGRIQSLPRRPFEVLLALKSRPTPADQVPESWLQAREVIEWLRNNNFPTSGVRAPVGILVDVIARDPIGAAQAAKDEAERFSARALIATGKRLNPFPSVWVKGADRPWPMADVSRGVGVKELLRGGHVFSTDTNESVEAALELLAHMEGSSVAAAVAGGWAAIEGLLADPSDRSSAADNLSILVACSFPRAELTALSYQVEKEHPVVCAELAGEETNRLRSRIVAQMIVEGRMPHLENPRDRAAVERVRKLLHRPAEELRTIQEMIGESMHRLYRQRNLILHGARLDSVALTASLRTVSKLVGAGMDRITHAHYAQNIRPLELVAKANLALATVKDKPPLACLDLLEVS